MRNLNCRKIRREIEEVAPGKWLSPDLNSHVLSCGACEKLLREQTRLRELVSSLGSVAAPGDFDFRLRARLADEKRGLTQPFMLGNLSFGLRSVAGLAILLLIASALMFVSFRKGSDNSLTAGVPRTGQTQQPAKPEITKEAIATNGTSAGQLAEANSRNVIEAGGNSPGSHESQDQQATKRRNGLSQMQVAVLRDTNRLKSRDLSSTQAAVLRRYDQVIDPYPTAAFPIDAVHQSLKVSLDDGRGSSRTISLPTVSFGSQSALSQSATPLMASARGAW